MRLVVSRHPIVGLCCLVAFAAAASEEPPQRQPHWLVGTWVLCEDPDKGAKDFLQFNADGSGLVIRDKGNLQFLHKSFGQTVSLLANANGVAVPIELTASPAFDHLLLHSKRTGSTSNYVRQDSPLAAACSVK